MQQHLDLQEEEKKGYPFNEVLDPREGSNFRTVTDQVRMECEEERSDASFVHVGKVPDIIRNEVGISSVIYSKSSTCEEAKEPELVPITVSNSGVILNPKPV